MALGPKLRDQITNLAKPLHDFYDCRLQEVHAKAHNLQIHEMELLNYIIFATCCVLSP